MTGLSLLSKLSIPIDTFFEQENLICLFKPRFPGKILVSCLLLIAIETWHSKKFVNCKPGATYNFAQALFFGFAN